MRLDQLNVPQPAVRGRRRKLDELARSIEEVGVLVPIVVRALGKAEYAVIAGVGRVEALRKNGASPGTKVPAVVVDVDDASATLLALVENTVREPMRPLDEAEVARVLVKEYGYSQQAVAAAVGRNQGTVSRWLRVFELDGRVLAALRAGRIEMQTAWALVPLIGQSKAQREVLALILKQGLDATRATALVTERRFGSAAMAPTRYTVAGAGRVDARTTRSGELQVTLRAKDRAGLARLLASVRKKLA